MLGVWSRDDGEARAVIALGGIVRRSVSQSADRVGAEGAAGLQRLFVPPRLAATARSMAAVSSYTRSPEALTWPSSTIRSTW